MLKHFFYNIEISFKEENTLVLKLLIAECKIYIYYTYIQYIIHKTI